MEEQPHLCRRAKSNIHLYASFLLKILFFLFHLFSMPITVPLQPKQPLHAVSCMSRLVFFPSTFPWNTRRTSARTALTPAFLVFWFTPSSELDKRGRFQRGFTPMWAFFCREKPVFFLMRARRGSGDWAEALDSGSCERWWGWGGCRERRDLKGVCEVRVICDVQSEAHEYFLLPVAGVQV